MTRRKPSRQASRPKRPNVSGCSASMSDTVAEKTRAAYRSGVADALWAFGFSAALAIRINVTDPAERDQTCIAVGSQLDALEEQLATATRNTLETGRKRNL